jgi:hypothetical protein
MEFKLKKFYRIVGTRVEENGELHGENRESVRLRDKAADARNIEAAKRSYIYVCSSGGKTELCPCK